MSDDEADPELLELLRQSLGLGPKTNDGTVSKDTGVLKDARYVYDNAIDVSIDMLSTKGAAASLYRKMQQRSFSTAAWAEHPLHPRTAERFSELDIVNFIFTMDVLNFSFWSQLSETERFQVEYREKRWTGYNSLVACLRRALDENIPITTPRFWRSTQCSDDVLRHVFRSATNEEIPLLAQRIAILREVAQVLQDEFPSNDQDSYDVEGTDASEHGSEEPAGLNNQDIGDPKVDVAQTSECNVTIKMQDHDKQNNDVVGEGADGLQNNASNISHDARPISVEDQAIVPMDLPITSSNIAIESISSQVTDTSDAPTTLQTAGPTSVHMQALTPYQTLQDESVMELIKSADGSAGRLVNLLFKYFPSFRDEFHFESRRVRFLKRAQIFVADLWAAFNGAGPGAFDDIDTLTMFADYRVPQMLHSLGILVYSPPLENHIRLLRKIESGHSWEVQLRGCSIWAVELLRREMTQSHDDTSINAVLIDFFLYDLAKEKEVSALAFTQQPHRTRSIWY